ncbi:crocetin glucosyltransferase, chloroplastic-like [Salvia hispanica]|uniref:crocetin glucosyltransferase, chloroplastic-like n=1 Tax=Salvia hispanica TaxID=49212 RepID=UPI002009800D|nr:crocetin glucosyltransferase, chloroplastic-like [Salvia hispanica]
MEHRHVLLVTFPAQGHINPSLQFAKKLIKLGIHVTFATSISARRRMAAPVVANGLTFLAFSDGFDDGYKLGNDANIFMDAMRSNGSKALRGAVAAAAEEGRPVTCLVYTLLLPWATEVARELHIPSALLWIQPATVFSIYYHFFNGFSDEITEKSDKPGWKIEIPGAPPLSKTDLPSFLLPSSPEAHKAALPTFKEQFDALDAEPGKPKVLVNTFDSLEAEALRAFDRYELIGVGPLIPSAFVNGEDPSDKSFGGDLFVKSDGCIEWLNSKPQSSVVYVSFGSLLRLPKAQMEEIAAGLLRSGRPFLWVIRAAEEGKEEEEELSCLEDLDKIGKIVTWCSQLEVLTHPSLGCFVTHCGWNSTLESLSCGVPVVAFPHWTDQGTNAKMIEDVWGTGARVRGNEDGIVESEEIWRCVEEVMDGGFKSVEFRRNASKWKGLAREAAAENGSSTVNLKTFLDYAS